ncbi:MAG: 2-oxo acid dehydrogenase subunit E2, partial [Flavobacteriaceae bacterium]|nr:2-oxo acid dehydrogenase subunit E2 [Flavobacteriaceae bacterium]
MSKFELKLPKMGESVTEATITSWLKEVGDTIELDEAIVEIATDKVDSEVPSEVEGVLIEKLFDVDAVVGVGQTIAIIETESGNVVEIKENNKASEAKAESVIPSVESVKSENKIIEEAVANLSSPSGKFYSPLVKNIAKAEGVTMDELEAIVGSGKDQRVTKNDILGFLKNRGDQAVKVVETPPSSISISQPKPEKTVAKAPVSVSGEDEIIEMTRMGKLIAKHMVNSTQISAHVQSFVEV